jgi:hypothetical protein
MGSKGHDKSITERPNDDNDKPNNATMFIIILAITLVLKQLLLPYPTSSKLVAQGQHSPPLDLLL